MNDPAGVPYTLSQTFAVAANSTGTAFEIKHDDQADFVCDEKDMVVTLQAALAPYPINYVCPREGAQRALTSGETNLPTLDMIGISATIRQQPLQKANAFVSAGAFASRADRGLQRTGFVMKQNDTISGKISNNSAVAVNVEVIFKGYLRKTA